MPSVPCIDRFFRSFQIKDYRAMAECYHDEAVFQDEVFDLQGREIAGMWHMLCERGRDLQVTYDILDTADQEVHAAWKATYTFSATGNKVHNHIQSEFIIVDGKIKTHRDRFDMWKWCSQALGWRGVLLGWSSVMKSKVRTRARVSLDGFLSSHPEYRR